VSSVKYALDPSYVGIEPKIAKPLVPLVGRGLEEKLRLCWDILPYDFLERVFESL
jgi:hypothetical protein